MAWTSGRRRSTRAAAVAAALMLAPVATACERSPSRGTVSATKSLPTAAETTSVVTTTVPAATATTRPSTGSTNARTSTTGPSASTTTPPPGQSGVRGQITAGPTCPVERPGDPRCAPRPVVATITATTPSGATAGSTTSAADGSYQLLLAPGSYQLSATTSMAMRCFSAPVTVSAGQMADLNLSCDTGIR